MLGGPHLTFHIEKKEDNQNSSMQPNFFKGLGKIPKILVTHRY